jgi:hypothetical protein
MVRYSNGKSLKTVPQTIFKPQQLSYYQILVEFEITCVQHGTPRHMQTRFEAASFASLLQKPPCRDQTLYE